MALRDRFGKFKEGLKRGGREAALRGQIKYAQFRKYGVPKIKSGGRRFAVASGRAGYSFGRGTVNVASRQASGGLSASEYLELRRLRQMRDQGIITDNETYLEEVRRLHILEKKAQLAATRRQAFYSRVRQGPPKRLTA